MQTLSAVDEKAPDLISLIEERCPDLFSARSVFVSQTPLTRMAQVIAAVEFGGDLPAFRSMVLANAPAVAQHDPIGAKGVFFGFYCRRI